MQPLSSSDLVCRSIRRGLVGGTAVALGLALGGCGGDDATGAGNGETTTTTAYVAPGGDGTGATDAEDGGAGAGAATTGRPGGDPTTVGS